MSEIRANNIVSENGLNPVGFSSGLNVGAAITCYAPTGIISATKYYGDGSGLSNISSVGGGTGVDFNDSIKSRWGGGPDLEIYHSGADSYIKDSGTGHLKIDGSRVQLRNVANDDPMVDCTGGAAVELFHNGTKMCETSTTGLKFQNGKGIDFSLNTAGGGTATSSVLEDYEEGTYSSTIVSSNATLQNGSATGYYIKVGNLVHVRGNFGFNTNDGSPAASGSDAITQSLPFARHGNGTFTGTMLQQNINWGGPTSLAHPHYFNPVVADYVCLVASDGIRFYMNKIEYAYERLNNSHMHVGFPGYTDIYWNVTYQTT